MTTVVAIQGANFAMMGTDSKISHFDGTGFAYQSGVLGPQNAKVAANGKYLIGAAGDVRAINIIHHAFHPPAAAPSLRGKKLDTFMTTKFVPALRDAFEKEGYAAPAGGNQTHIAEHSSTIIVAVNATIYVIDSDYGWMSDSSGVYAIGTGALFAMGAMNVLIPKRGVNKVQAKQVIVKALNTAAKYDPYTGPPFTTFIQETK